ncbi:hypothetical protein Cantr_01071 [Candida viswanathii]|uniref:Uncharacterized protein n=1 Tax=Candida viswanathii TaxID=5486 RepID=A0A367YI08_9ASCO|nr:hypothetical protein Cantr_01071 [Candida viswanathii]
MSTPEVTAMEFPSPPPTSSTVYKRRNDQTEEDRSIKNLTKDQQITAETEWPQFIHPDGGIIKITPWGTIRQYTDPITNEPITKFEDCNLEDYSFRLENIEKIYQTPDTPQSIYNKKGGRALRLSPSDDAEGYVIEGYRELQLAEILPKLLQQQQQQHQQFLPEHENYFGMTDEEHMEEYGNAEDYGHMEEFGFNHDGDEEML